MRWLVVDNKIDHIKLVGFRIYYVREIYIHIFWSWIEKPKILKRPECKINSETSRYGPLELEFSSSISIRNVEVSEDKNINLICEIDKNYNNREQISEYDIQYIWKMSVAHLFAPFSISSRDHDVFFSHSLFIPDPTRRKQDRKITVDRVILLILRLARVLSILVTLDVVKFSISNIYIYYLFFNRSWLI